MADIKIDLSGIDLSGVEGAVTIQVNCGTCAGPTTLQFADYGGDSQHQATPYTWPRCGVTETRYRFAGRLVSVTAEHEPERPSHPSQQ